MKTDGTQSLEDSQENTQARSPSPEKRTTPTSNILMDQRNAIVIGNDKIFYKTQNNFKAAGPSRSNLMRGKQGSAVGQLLQNSFQASD